MQRSTIASVILFLHCVFAVSAYSIPNNARELFEEFKREYGKNYNDYENEKRFAIFQDNLVRAEHYQMEDEGTAEYGVTAFSDLTAEEFAELYTNARFLPPPNMKQVALEENDEPSLESFDWREKGAVGKVLQQGFCGSCWAFSVVGNIEGQWFLKTGKLFELSKQQLVDCDRRDKGCRGGYPPFTYKEVRRMGGLVQETDYPYIARKKSCKLGDHERVAYINESVLLTADEEKQAAWLSVHGPLSSGLNARHLQLYKFGILNPPYCPASGMNHAVLTVGYGVEGEIPYWIVKNSWGEQFGEQGYFRIHRGTETCGINKLCTSAVIY